MKKKILATIATMLVTVMMAVPVFAAGIGTASAAETATLDASGTVAADKLGEVYGVSINFNVDSLSDIGAYLVCLTKTDGTLLKGQATTWIAGSFNAYVPTDGADIDAGGTGTMKYTQDSPLLSADAASLYLTGNESINSVCTVNSVTWLDKDGNDITKAAATDTTKTDTTTGAEEPVAKGTATGDNTIVWIMMAGVVVAAGAGIVVYGKKKLAK